MKTKVVFIISNIDKALAFEWIATKVDYNKIELVFVLLNAKPSALQEFLVENEIKVYSLEYRGKRDILYSFLKILKILKKEKPSFIHTHLFEASLLGLLAGKLAGIPNRIVTRHHGNQHHVYFPKAVRYDKLVNSLATTIVAPSASVKEILVKQESVNPAKIKVIHHGFELSYFYKENDLLIASLKQKYNPRNQWPVVGVISRYTELKGLQFVIPAFKRILLEYPDALLILANANGDYAAQVQEHLKSLNKRNYIEISFEPDIATLYRLFQIFVHVPVAASSEAFGQTYIEALAAGVPSVFTLSGVANEFIRHKENALVVPYQNTEAIYAGIRELIQNTALRQSLISNGQKDVAEKFGLPVMIEALEKLYER